MRSIQLCHTVTSKGHFYFMDGVRCTREAMQEAKFGRRHDCFITRATAAKVQNFSTIYTK